MQAHLERITGIDLTEIPGINTIIALTIISEIDVDMSRWKDSKHFALWLCLCPGNKVSGGKKLGGAASRKTSNRAAKALRIAANSLYISTSFFRCIFKAIKVSSWPYESDHRNRAHKIAVIIYNMLKNGVGYIETGADYYEQQYKDRTIKNRVKSLGFELIAVAT